MTEPAVFRKTLEKTEQWLEAVARRMGSADAERGYRALRSVLHALRDRLPVDEAAQLGAQMPMLVRGIYYEGWKPADTPEKWRDGQELMDRIAADMPDLDPTQRQRAAQAVFAVLDEFIGSGEIEDVRQAMPEEVRELWQQAA
jgi:uncharacterized protein (DUF2267 family)